MNRRWVDLICVGVLCVILVLGLWPFHSPENSVTWLSYRNGLAFGKWATAISSGAFPMASQQSGSGTVEVWLQPRRRWDSSTILSFYTPGNPHPFSLRQSQVDLELKAGNRLYAANVFRRSGPVFLTVTTGVHGTKIYANGNPLGVASQFRLPPNAFAGRLILGDSPGQPDNWSGEMLGVAVYDSELPPARVQRHCQTWTRGTQPAISADDRNVALYLFDEREGSVVHNHAGAGIDVDIPRRYHVLDKVFLEPFWKEFSFSNPTGNV